MLRQRTGARGGKQTDCTAQRGKPRGKLVGLWRIKRVDHVKQKVKCPNCECSVDLLISEFGGKVVVEPPEASPYIDKKHLLDHYKKVKGFTLAAGKAWDETHRTRAFHHAKKILAAIPVVETAKRAIGWTADEWIRRRLGTGAEWNLGTVEKWVAEFLVAEARTKAQLDKPRCVNCQKPAVDGAVVCLECSWCWKCDEAGRASEKNPQDMVDGLTAKPICKECDKDKK